MELRIDRVRLFLDAKGIRDASTYALLQEFEAYNLRSIELLQDTLMEKVTNPNPVSVLVGKRHKNGWVCTHEPDCLGCFSDSVPVLHKPESK